MSRSEIFQTKVLLSPTALRWEPLDLVVQGKGNRAVYLELGERERAYTGECRGGGVGIQGKGEPTTGAWVLGWQFWALGETGVLT